MDQSTLVGDVFVEVSYRSSRSIVVYVNINLKTAKLSTIVMNSYKFIPIIHVLF